MWKWFNTTNTSMYKNHGDNFLGIESLHNFGNKDPVECVGVKNVPLDIYVQKYCNVRTKNLFSEYYTRLISRKQYFIDISTRRYV